MLKKRNNLMNSKTNLLDFIEVETYTYFLALSEHLFVPWIEKWLVFSQVTHFYL